MRLGELARLRKDTVDFDAALITLTQTKTNRVHRVPIHPALVGLLRAATSRSSSNYVFTNLAGRPHSHRASQGFGTLLAGSGSVTPDFMTSGMTSRPDCACNALAST
jgi:integrase